jgi:hypothetical protein
MYGAYLGMTVMGWANCGHDSRGRPIGYAHEATCDFPGCRQEIHRGLAYACGGEHGDDEVSCERYFCDEHQQSWVRDGSEMLRRVCAECEAAWRKENPAAAKALDEE